MYVPLRIVILALSLVGGKEVEARARSVVVLAHVPLAHVGGRIAFLAKSLRPVRPRRRQLGEIVDDAVRMRVDAG